MSTMNQVGNSLKSSTGTGSFVGSNSPVFTSPILGAASSASTSFSSTSGVIGTITNNDAAAGSVGQLLSQVITAASPTNLTNNNIAAIATITLTAGDWDIFGNFGITGAAGTSVTYMGGWFAANGSVFPATQIIGSTQFNPAYVIGTNVYVYTIPATRVSTTGGSFRLVTLTNFTVSTLAGFGGIYARRRR